MNRADGAGDLALIVGAAAVGCVLLGWIATRERVRAAVVMLDRDLEGMLGEVELWRQLNALRREPDPRVGVPA